VTTDTSTEAVQALIAEIRETASGVWDDAADTLAALLDERTATASFNASAHSQAQDRIRDLEASKALEESVSTSYLRRAERAEADLHIEMAELFDVQAERDKLVTELANLEAGFKTFMKSHNKVLDENERLAAKLAGVTAERFHEAYERLSFDFDYVTRVDTAVPWADVPEQNKRLMEATVAAILADTDEGSER
jgi:hypothetical protein